MANLNGKDLVKFAKSKIGTPYVYGAKGADGKFTQQKLNWLAKNYPKVFTTSYIRKAKKFVGQVCCDCSGLISWYTGKVYGSSQLYSKAVKRGTIKTINKAPIGAILWKSGHVGVYIGNGECIEEKGIAYGCVKSKISNTRFTHWLTFDFMDYSEVREVEVDEKKTNPYKEPKALIKTGSRGNGVKWLQFELQEAGFKEVSIDGIFGSKTKKGLKSFQKSSKITVDGICGPQTRKALIAD